MADGPAVPAADGGGPRHSGTASVTPALSAVADLLRAQAGITVPPARATALAAAVDRVTPGAGPAGFAAAAADPLHGRALLDRLIDEVTVRETAFLRDRGQLDLIPWASLLSGAARAG